MSVKETAEAILAYQPLFTVAECVFAVQNGTEDDGHHGDVLGDFTDLQAMANLWLTKQAVITAMKDFRSSVNGEGGTAFADFAVDRFDRAIEALEDNNE